MNDYRSIESHIRRARLERGIMLGDLIAGGIVAAWAGIKRLTIQVLATIKARIDAPDERKIAPPVYF